MLLNMVEIEVRLVEITNELEEIVLGHQLTGNLSFDIENRQDEVSEFKIAASALDFSFEYSDKPYEMTEDDRRTTSSNDQIPMLLGGSAGVSIIGVVGIILSPLAKIGKTKRLQKRRSKKRKRILQKKSIEAIDEIRDDLGDDFFIKTLKIPKEHIDFFINYCKPKKIGELYVRNNKINIIEVFLEDVKSYKVLYNLK